MAFVRTATVLKLQRDVLPFHHPQWAQLDPKTQADVQKVRWVVAAFRESHAQADDISLLFLCTAIRCPCRNLRLPQDLPSSAFGSVLRLPSPAVILLRLTHLINPHVRLRSCAPAAKHRPARFVALHRLLCASKSTDGRRPPRRRNKARAEADRTNCCAAAEPSAQSLR